jgi:phosphoribosyl-AMP cyclohydrolase
VTRGQAPGAADAATGDRARPIVVDDDELATVRFGTDGLVVTVVQEVASREVLMVAYMDAEALRRTLESGRTWFWSRSRAAYWCKGETSGDRQWVRSVSYDCDGDALLVVVDQEGRGACHTGARSCFFRSFGEAR